MLAPWKKSCDKPRQHIKKQNHFADKGLSSQSYDFPSSHVWMWELDYKKGWALKNWCFLNVVLRRLLRVPYSKEIKPVHPKGDHSWVFIGRTDVEAETPIFWPPDEKSRLIGKDPEAGKDWGQEKGVTEDEIVGWMASSTQWTRVWANSGRWWRTGQSGMLWSTGLQRVGHDWVTEPPTCSVPVE